MSLMSLICFVIAIIAAVLAAFHVHWDVTVPLAIAFVAAGLLFAADVVGVARNRNGVR